MSDHPLEIREICQAFLIGLQAALGDKLVSVTIYGAAAFPNTFAIGDIDFHVIVQDELTDSEKADIYRLHTSLKEKYPPLGSELDGYYLLLADTHDSPPPRSQMWARAVASSWALHCAPMRAGHCITLFGPPPIEIYPSVTWADIEAALLGELAFVEAHLDRYPGYCILNLCRLMYSFATRNVVVSKAQAAQWAEALFPEWCGLIQAAKKEYQHQASIQDIELMSLDIVSFFSFSGYYINQVVEKNDANQPSMKCM